MLFNRTRSLSPGFGHPFGGQHVRWRPGSPSHRRDSAYRSALLMPPQAIAALVTVLSAAHDDSRIQFRLDHGAAELVWITPSTFHFRRTFVGELPLWAAPQDAQPPVIEMETRSDAVLIR